MKQPTLLVIAELVGGVQKENMDLENFPNYWFHILNGFALIGSVTSIYFVSGKTNRERRFGMWVSVWAQPFFFGIGFVTGAWAIMALATWRWIHSIRGIINNPIK